MNNELILRYDYRDEADTLIYQIVRKEYADGGKKISQRRLDDSGGWIYNLDGVTPVPFRLPDVLRVIANQGLVFVVEGEKKAELLNAALKGYNAIATCNSGGAGHWGAEQSKWLKGARVCLIPDCDVIGADASEHVTVKDNPGLAHVQIAARSLAGSATSIKLVELPGLAEKEDIADWIAAGHLISELQALYHAAGEFTSPPLPLPEKPVSYKPQSTRSAGDARLVAWAHAALDGGVSDLCRLNDGRFHELKAAANRLGTIAAHGLLTENECVDHLVYACEVNGYVSKRGKNRQSVEREARFYFQSGLPHKCDLPPEPERPEARVVFQRPSLTQMWHKGIPTIVRGLINAYVYPSTGPILELWHEAIQAGLIPGNSWVTVNQLMAANEKLERGLSEASIRRGVIQGTKPTSAAFLAVMTHYKDSLSESAESTDPQFGITARKSTGRESEQYRMLPVEVILDNLISFIMAPLIQEAFPIKSHLVAPIRAEFLRDLDIPDAESKADELMERYGGLIEAQAGYQTAWKEVKRKYRKIVHLIRNPSFAPIPAGWTYRNASEYMTCCARALVEAGGGETQYSIADLCLYIGCGDRTVKAVLNRAGIEILKNQMADKPLKSLSELKDLKWNPEMKGFPVGVLSSQKKAVFPIERKGLLPFCESEIENGATLTIRYRQANRQRIATGAVHEPPIARPRLWLSSIAYMQGVMQWMVVKLIPLVENEPEQAEVEPVVSEVKEAVETAPKPVSEPREKWEVVNLRKALDLAMGRTAKPEVKVSGRNIIRMHTGEIEELSPQLSLDLLLQPGYVEADPDDQPLTVCKPLTGDSLIDWIVTDLGGTVTAIYEHALQAAA